MPYPRFCECFPLPNATGITATQRRLRSRCWESPSWKSCSALLVLSDSSKHAMNAIEYYVLTGATRRCHAMLCSPALTAERFRVDSTALSAQPNIWPWDCERSVLSARTVLLGQVKPSARQVRSTHWQDPWRLLEVAVISSG